MSSSIPDEILQAKNDGRIPDDVSLEYLAESRDYEAIVGMLTVMVFSILIVFLRAYARHSLIHAFGLDDILALACVVRFSVLKFLVSGIIFSVFKVYPDKWLIGHEPLALLCFHGCTGCCSYQSRIWEAL